MDRKSFLKSSAICAIAVSTSGFIKFNGTNFEGDCETTSDILGPFYRPNSPLRSDLLIKDVNGQIVELSGIVRHEDCKTPYKKAKVELWHCNSQGVYDNTSDEYRHRGGVNTDEEGRYSFTTILPSPYDAGGFMRPAHFHLMVSAAGYQSLVTQLYFAGDAHIANDRWASSPKAKKRILSITDAANGIKKVVFDVSMAARLAIEPSSIGRLTGMYSDESNADKKLEFFQKDNMLWVKNEVFGVALEYVGNNKFQPRNTPEAGFTYVFEIPDSGIVKLTYPYRNNDKINYGLAVKK